MSLTEITSLAAKTTISTRLDQPPVRLCRQRTGEIAGIECLNHLVLMRFGSLYVVSSERCLQIHLSVPVLRNTFKKTKHNSQINTTSTTTNNKQREL